MNNRKVLYITQYTYGILTYLVQITQENYDIDWERDEEIVGTFYFIEYGEITGSMKNRVGGFDILNDAFTWSNQYFGNLYWVAINE